MAKQLQLSIPTPCHENWDNMTPADKGRFCDSCQKQVVDFSSMSDRQVAEFFKKPSKGSVCGRFMSDQLDRDIEIPTKRIPWVKYFFQFALPAFLVSLKTSSSKAQGEVILSSSKKDTVAKPFSQTVIKLGNTSRALCVKALTEDTIVAVINSPFKNSDTGIRTINGVLINEKGDGVPWASVRVKGTRTGVAVDTDGRFHINAKTGNVLIVSGTGLELTEVAVGSSNMILIPVKIAAITGNPIIVTAGMVSYTRTSKKKKKEIALFTPVFKDTAFSSFKVFPNPVSASSSITIEAKKQEEGYYNFELLNQSGQTVHQQKLWIDEEARLLSIDVPNIPAGSYFLVLINNKTGKKFTEKIIVQ